MKEENTSKKSVSILIVPEEGTQPVSFRVPHRFFKVAVYALCTLLVLMIIGAALYGHLVYETFQARILRLKIQELIEQNKKVKQLEERLSEIDRIEEQLRIMAGAYFEKPEEKLAEVAFTKAETDLLTEQEINLFIRNYKRQEQALQFGDSQPARRKVLNAIPNYPPLHGWITNGFREQPDATGRSHLGIDIAVSENTPVRASADGIVTFAGWKRDVGYALTIDHGFGIASLYGHNARLNVSRGTYVHKGEIIAFSGNTGISSAPHLHLEISRNGKKEDPLKYITF